MQAFKHSPTDDARCRMEQICAASWSAVEDQVKDPMQTSDQGPNHQPTSHPTRPMILARCARWSRLLTARLQGGRQHTVAAPATHVLDITCIDREGHATRRPPQGVDAALTMACEERTSEHQLAARAAPQATPMPATLMREDEPAVETGQPGASQLSSNGQCQGPKAASGSDAAG